MNQETAAAPLDALENRHEKLLSTVAPGTFKDIIVAVHGIGEQKRFSTVRSVATRLAASRALLGKGRGHPVAPQPLGYSHSDVRNIASVRLLDDVETLKDMELASIGFAEVFW